MKHDKFTKAELNHILDLIYMREIDGGYLGNKAQFEKMEKRIKEKVSLLIVEAK